eukprot:COSAG01_NODE_66210_length_271_cov_0.511628_1_plen_70_part_01
MSTDADITVNSYDHAQFAAESLILIAEDDIHAESGQRLTVEAGTSSTVYGSSVMLSGENEVFAHGKLMDA